MTSAFQTPLFSKLLYGLAAICLKTPEQKRLDSFHCYCLRRLGRIPSAYHSRVSNSAVFARFNQTPLSERISRQQLLYFQEVAALGQHSPLRKATFHRDLLPLTFAHVRKFGRPRHTWAEQMLHRGLHIAGTRINLEESLQNRSVRKALVMHASL